MPDGNLLLFPDLEPARETTTAKRPDAPPDAAARTAALDIQRSFVVEAPAGSGKTGLLIQRYLKLLGDESVSTPEQVLAITFTNKAAGELRDRVLGHLASARANTAVNSEFDRATRDLATAVLERDRALDWRILDQPHRLNLRTIDSISAEIARSLPVLSGSGGALNPTDSAEPLFRKAARRTLLLLGNDGPDADPQLDAAIRDLLLHRDANLGDCETLLSDMLGVRDQWAALVPLDRASLSDEVLDREVLPRLQLALERSICADLTTLSGQIPGDVLADLAALAEEMSWSNGYNGEPSTIAVCKGRRNAPGSALEDTEHWRALVHLLLTGSKDWRKGVARNHVGFEIAKHHAAQLKALIERISHRDDLKKVFSRITGLPPAEYPAAQWAVAKSLFRVLRRALIELQFVFAEHGQCDFTELSLLARAALRSGSGPHDLTSARGARLQHLLVDEMQDTSSGQYELIQLLTESWDGHTQTVFLVGDPRQSIYLFRQARVERFLATLRTCRLGDLPLTALRLTANFRSQGDLIGQFNETFRPIFEPGAGQTLAAGSLPYEDAAAVLPPSSDAAGLTWHAHAVAINPPDSNGATNPAVQTNALLRRLQERRNAKKIYEIVQSWREKPLPPTRQLLPSGQPEPWRIAVLVRSRSHLLEVISLLRKQQMPFRAVEIEPLVERQEILDLTALTRALLHPADRVAMLALLRAPWCGLSLADLHTLTGCDDPAYSKQSVLRLIEERGDLLSPDACLRMRRLWTVLQAAGMQRGRLSTSQLVERTWRTLGGDAALTADERINARRYFELLDEIESVSGTVLDLAVLDRRLQRLHAEPQPIPPGMAAVELLTIHRAKGLEWDVVLIPALERSPGRNRPRLLTWAELDPSGDAASIMLAPIAARGEEVDALTGWLRSIHRDHEAAERKRLFYVAATRAREELHLFASPDITAQGQLRKGWPDSLLSSAWPAAEPHFVGAVEPIERASAAALRESLVVDLAAAASIYEMPKPNQNGASAPTQDFEVVPESTQVEMYAAPARPLIRRLPATFDAAARFAEANRQRLPYGSEISAAGEPSAAPASPFTRPQGSFAARAFGNTVHAMLEMIGASIAGGTTPAELLTGLAEWTPRISGLLRSNGVSPAEVDRYTRETRAALNAVLRHREGLWVLSAHRNAASELAITAHTQESSALTSVRIDRTFHAGPEPHEPGDDYLWIIDYKTASHGSKGVDEFLASERDMYAPQLESYARILARDRSLPVRNVRLGLYFSSIPRLLWWQP